MLLTKTFINPKSNLNFAYVDYLDMHCPRPPPSVDPKIALKRKYPEISDFVENANYPEVSDFMELVNRAERSPNPGAVDNPGAAINHNIRAFRNSGNCDSVQDFLSNYRKSNKKTKISRQKKKDHYMKQHDLFLQDRLQYGDEQTGDFYGFRWIARRNPVMLHWNAYIYLIRHLSNEEYGELDELAHHGLTGQLDNMSPGFDTAHIGDFVPDFYTRGLVEPDIPDSVVGGNLGEYRDLGYVKTVLERMAKYLSKLK